MRRLRELQDYYLAESMLAECRRLLGEHFAAPPAGLRYQEFPDDFGLIMPLAVAAPGPKWYNQGRVEVRNRNKGRAVREFRKNVDDLIAKYPKGTEMLVRSPVEMYRDDYVGGGHAWVVNFRVAIRDDEGRIHYGGAQIQSYRANHP